LLSLVADPKGATTGLNELQVAMQGVNKARTKLARKREAHEAQVLVERKALSTKADELRERELKVFAREGQISHSAPLAIPGLCKSSRMLITARSKHRRLCRLIVSRPCRTRLVCRGRSPPSGSARGSRWRVGEFRLCSACIVASGSLRSGRQEVVAMSLLAVVDMNPAAARR
jgi:hypothetical protein